MQEACRQTCRFVARRDIAWNAEQARKSGMELSMLTWKRPLHVRCGAEPSLGTYLNLSRLSYLMWLSTTFDVSSFQRAWLSTVLYIQYKAVFSPPCKYVRSSVLLFSAFEEKDSKNIPFVLILTKYVFPSLHAAAFPIPIPRFGFNFFYDSSCSSETKTTVCGELSLAWPPRDVGRRRSSTIMLILQKRSMYVQMTYRIQLGVCFNRIT